MNMRAATIRGTGRGTYRSSAVGRAPYRARSRARMRLGRLELLGVAAAVLLFGLGLWTSYEVRTLAAEIAMLKARSAELDSAHRSLSEQEAAMLDRKNLARLGLRLGLHRPGAGQVVTLN